MDGQSWGGPGPGSYEHAKSFDLINPNIPLIASERGELFAYRVPEPESFGNYTGPYAPTGRIVPAPEFAMPPEFDPWSPPMGPPPDDQQNVDPRLEEQQYDPWGPPLGPPPEELQETQPGFPPDEDHWYDPGTWEWPGELKEEYKEGWEGTFDAPFFSEGEFDIDPGEGKGLPGEGTFGALPEIGGMVGMIGALIAITILPKLLDR